MGNIVPYLRAETLTDADREYLRTRTGLSPKGTQLTADAEPPQNVTFTDTTGWGPSTLEVTYNAKTLFNVDDATQFNWQLKDANDNFKVKGGEISHPTPSQVRVSFQIEPGASTYQLVGSRG